MSPLTWPVLMPLWLRLDLQARWEGAAALVDLALGVARGELLKRLGAVDADAAVEMVTEARADAEAAWWTADDMENARDRALRERDAALRSAEMHGKHLMAFRRGQTCETCKHWGDPLCFGPSDCNQDFDKWEAKEIAHESK